MFERSGQQLTCVLARQETCFQEPCPASLAALPHSIPVRHTYLAVKEASHLNRGMHNVGTVTQGWH